jgi:hypothetical protein
LVIGFFSHLFPHELVTKKVYHFLSIVHSSNFGMVFSNISCFYTGKKSESETKKLVQAIHDLKERHKKETEGLMRIKEQLRHVQERQQREREVGYYSFYPLKTKRSIKVLQYSKQVSRLGSG